MYEFDLDGVLINILDVVEDEALKIFGIKVDFGNNKVFNILENEGMKRDEIENILNNVYSRYEEYEIEDGTRELLESLGKPIKVVTARHSDSATETVKCLEYHFPGIPFALCFSNGHRLKLPFINKMKIFVEDRGESALYLAEAGVMVNLLDRSYNQGFDHQWIMRIYSLRELIR